MIREVPLAFAERIAKEAGKILGEAGGRRQRSDHKRSPTDLVTEYDRRSEAYLVGEIDRAYPDHFVLAEEGGAHGAPGRFRWLVDPLDGTTNFAHGLPIYCVSIALEVDGALDLAVVEAPALGWTFSAARGEGARLNGAAISVSDIATLAGALLTTGFPYDRATNPQNNFAEFVTLQKRAQGVRRLGSAALDLALVAAGRLDGYWERHLKPWDLAAGALLVVEAGGRITSWDGGPFEVDRAQAVATNGLIHQELLAGLAKAQLA